MFFMRRGGNDTIIIFSVKVDGEEIVLSVFDTAGQEEYDM